MKTLFFVGGLVLSVSLAGTAHAQDSQAAPRIEAKLAETPGPVTKPSERPMLKEGADVNLKFAQDLSSKTSNEVIPSS